MMKTWTDFRAKDIAQDAKSITEGVLMILKDSLSVLIKSVRSFMVQRDPLIFTLKSSTTEETKQIEKRWLRH